MEKEKRNVSCRDGLSPLQNRVLGAISSWITVFIENQTSKNDTIKFSKFKYKC